MRRVAPNRLSLIFDESETVLLYTQGLNSFTDFAFQIFSIFFYFVYMFLSSLFQPIIFSKMYIFNHFKF
jgi:hypothetical protein